MTGKPFVIDTLLSPAEVLARLRETTNERTWYPAYGTRREFYEGFSFAGTVQDTSFELQVVQAAKGGTGGGVLRGTVEAQANGARLRGTVATGAAAKVFAVVWAFPTLFVGCPLLRAAVRPGGARLDTVLPLTFILAIDTVIWFASVASVRSARKTLADAVYGHLHAS